MSPAKHGYVQCAKCHCWRKSEELESGVCKSWRVCAEKKSNGTTGPQVPA